VATCSCRKPFEIAFEKSYIVDSIYAIIYHDILNDIAIVPPLNMHKIPFFNVWNIQKHDVSVFIHSISIRIHGFFLRTVTGLSQLRWGAAGACSQQGASCDLGKQWRRKLHVLPTSSWGIYLWNIEKYGNIYGIHKWDGLWNKNMEYTGI
jgi:hypothetical protein